ncbi:MAG: 3-phosphoshikimate 1-carboxyvinyltransferase [Candidatus Dasytiphilus stammeri]
MLDFVTLQPISLVNGTITVPGSKSISNRALVIAAQAHGITRLTNLLDSEDVRHMLKALHTLGISYTLSQDNTVCDIVGCGGPIYVKEKIELFLGNAGTAMRPLTALLSLTPNDIILTGDARMKERPLGALVHALRQGEAIIDIEKDVPPVHLRGGFQGGKIIIDSSQSSQFLTALLMAAPLAPKNTQILITGKLVSRPYIDITLRLLRDFKVKIVNNNYREFLIRGNQHYHSPGRYIIEGDASSASYFLAAGAVKGGKVIVSGIGSNSKQGDIYFANIIQHMGAKIEWRDNEIICQRGRKLKSININMNDMPDAAMTLATIALFATGTTTLSNIYNWRIKETDRLTAMSTELRKVGAQVIEGQDYISITPPVKITSTEINTYNDHRIAMCFSLLALASEPVTIVNPNCVRKTFPSYFSQLANISSTS